jgi:hypothetical protein
MKTFYDDFARVIDDAQLSHSDNDVKLDDTEIESDNYIGMEIAMARGGDGTLIHAKVQRRVTDEEGIAVGTSHSNPLLDSRRYEVEFADGHIDELTANIIAENLLSQVDEEGRRQMMLSGIIDH